MRIAIVTRGDLYPTNHGAAVKIVRTAEALSRLGATVCVITEDRDAYLRYIEGRVETVPYGERFRASQDWPGMSQAGRWAERICTWVGYPSEEFFLYRAQFDPAWWARVLYVGRAENIDVFQAEFPGYGLACWMAARILGGQSSIVQHNVEWDRLQDVSGMSAEEVRRIKSMEQFALGLVDEIIAVSAEDRDRMVAAGIDAARVTVIPHGVDTWRYARATGEGIRSRYGIGAKAPLLFFHGTLHYWPNTEAVRFIAEQLLPRLLEKKPDLRVVIAGVNPPTYYRHEAIVFPGAVEDVPAHVVAADLCLCPVRSGGGTRMKILEYFAGGKACVSTPKGAEGIRYKAGRELVEADNADAFAGEVLRLLDDANARERIGTAAQRFSRFYDWTAVCQRYLDLYDGQHRGTDYNRDALAALEAKKAPPVALEPAVVGPRVDRHLPEREVSKPLTLLLLVNRGCNLKCSFCDLWDNPQEMPWASAVALLDQAAAIGTKTLVITGGEPFLYKPLFDLVAAAKARGMGVNITTNGTLIQKRWEDLVGSGLDSLSISIDGKQATHEQLRGQKGCYNRAMKGLEAVRAQGGIDLSIYMVVTRENVDEISAVFDLAQEKGVGFDFWPVNDAEEHYLRTETERKAYRRAVEHVAAQDPAVADRIAFYEAGLTYHASGLGAVRCLGLVDQYGVTFTGDLIPCCVWGKDGLVVGNVFETPLAELWESDKVQRARQHLWGTGCTEGCFNHSLYELLVSTGEPFSDWKSGTAARTTNESSRRSSPSAK
jgi:MoaA/NifB/PqqE/SkfB family radical SAM enzyme/glycosyltransferase involved in cell wall biosynthesis